MIEILLEEFEDYYKEQLEAQFFKIKKAVKKQLSDINESLLEIKVCTDHFIEAGEGKIEEKALKSLHFFSDKIRKEIDEVGVPEEDITYDAMYNLLNSIKKLFTNINDIAKKSIPKFQKIGIRIDQRGIDRLNHGRFIGTGMTAVMAEKLAGHLAAQLPPVNNGYIGAPLAVEIRGHRLKR